MKKSIFFILSILLVSQVYSQTEFNKWSIELNGGFNKPMGPLTPGYFSPTLNIGHTDFGARYMFNEKFGLATTFGFGKFREAKGTTPFESSYFNFGVLGVMNWGRLLNLESLTRKFTLLSEGGFGMGGLDPQARVIQDFDTDYVYSFTGGIRALYSISPRVSLQGKINATVNGRQRFTFDGNEFNQDGRPFDPEIPYIHATGTWWAGTIGLNFYLGKAEQHADWYIASDKYATKDELNAAVTEIKDMLKDSDGDGIADYLDKEPNTPAGARVNQSGVTLDSDQDGTPDHLDKCPFLPGPSSTQGCPVEEIREQVDYLKKAITDNYVNVYFGFDSAKPLEFSISAANFVSNFLKKNPGVSLEIKGYADELGAEDYNIKLSERRAKAVYNILIASGIDSARLSFKGYGEDTSVDKSSPEGRQMARRVSFDIQ